MINPYTYLPARSWNEDTQWPSDLGDGQVAINIPNRRLWIGGTDGQAIEIFDLHQLMDCWIATINRHVSRDKVPG